MPDNIVPILAVRSSLSLILSSGSSPALNNPSRAWASVGIDYGNEGSEDNPPTLSYINEKDTTVTNTASLGTDIAILLPVSAEGVIVPLEDGDLIDYRHPRWSAW